MPSFGLESKGHSSFVPEHYKSKTILVTPFKDWFVFTKKKKKKSMETSLFFKWQVLEKIHLPVFPRLNHL